LVQPGTAPLIWPHVEPMIARALAYANGTAEPADVLQRVVEGQAWLWLVLEAGGPTRGVAVSEVLTFPRAREANIWLIAGEGMPGWLGALGDALEQWARSLGCVAIRGRGRKGWLPFMQQHGYAQIAVEYRKEIEP